MGPNKPDGVVGGNTGGMPPQPTSPITPGQPIVPPVQTPTQPQGQPPELVIAPSAPTYAQPPQQPVMPPQPPGAVVAGQPAANPVFGTPVAPAGVIPPQKKKIPKWAIVAAGVAIVVVVAAVLLVPKLLGGGIALTTYQGDGYSTLVPEEYTKETQSSGVMFSEDDEKETRSVVYVNGEKFKTELSDSDRDELVAYLEDGFGDLLEQNVGTDVSITNKNIDKTQYEGMEARRITADYEKYGKKNGEIHALFVVDNKGIYVVMVVADQTDMGLQKNVDKIINSLEIEG